MGGVFWFVWDCKCVFGEFDCIFLGVVVFVVGIFVYVIVKVVCKICVLC